MEQLAQVPRGDPGAVVESAQEARPRHSRQVARVDQQELERAEPRPVQPSRGGGTQVECLERLRRTTD